MIRTRCQTHKSKQKVASLSTRCQYRNFGAAIDEALNTGHGFFSCNLSIANMPAMAFKEKSHRLHVQIVYFEVWVDLKKSGLIVLFVSH